MKKLTGILISLALTTVFSLSSNNAFASVSCTPIYGGGETCITQGKLDVNKKVAVPGSDTKGGVLEFRDTLNFSDPRYQANLNVPFQIFVTNNDSANLASVEVTDTLPNYVTFVSVSIPHTFDANTRVLKFNLTNLGPNETRKVDLVVKVVEPSMLPNESVVCTVNQVTARSIDNQMDSDNAQFCIEKQVTVTKGGLPILPVPQKKFQAPPTGPEMLALVGLIPGALAGFALRRKSNSTFKGGDK